MEKQELPATMYRTVKHTIAAPLVNMGPIRLRQPIPAAGTEQISPFILLHHFDFMMEPGQGDFNVPPHPHRGFMPITFMYEGAIEHEDSLGNTKVIGNDEVQWINAARGIIHSEKAGKEFIKQGGRFQGVQLWVNIPAAAKMAPPSYQPLTKDELILIEKKGVQFRLVSGSYDGHRGPAHSDVVTGMMRMKQQSDFTFHFPASSNVVFYMLEGEAIVNKEQTAHQYDLLYFDNSDGPISIDTTDAEATLLILSGEPINEPLVTHGPYVMNTQTEIMEAMRDYQNGKMGFLY